MAEAAKTTLLLIGTVHRDPKGYRKLLRLLRQERPSVVTVELSPYGRKFRAREANGFRALLRENLKWLQREEKRSLREIMAHSAIQSIFLLLKEPYEWRAARDYTLQQEAAVREIDISSYARDKLAHLPELVSVSNLRALIGTPSHLIEDVKAHYRRARFLFCHPPAIWPRNPETEERESFMAGKIRRLMEKMKGEKLLHVGGWEHLVEAPGQRSLFGLLADLRPERLLLMGC